MPPCHRNLKRQASWIPCKIRIKTGPTEHRQESTWNVSGTQLKSKFVTYYFIYKKWRFQGRFKSSPRHQFARPSLTTKNHGQHCTTFPNAGSHTDSRFRTIHPVLQSRPTRSGVSCVLPVPFKIRKALLGYKNSDITTHCPAPELDDPFKAANRACGKKFGNAPVLLALKQRAVTS